MSEIKRPKLTVQAELNNTLARAGALQFNIKLQEKDLAAMNAQIDALNIEFKLAESAEAEAAATEVKNEA